MRQTYDESSTVLKAKESDISGYTLIEKISSTHDPNDVHVPELEPEEQEDAATKELE